MPTELSYEIGTHSDKNPEYNGMQYIICLKCKFKSWNPYDVRNKYCAACHIFHGDESSAISLRLLNPPPETRIPTLSPQARWYLTGRWPIYDNSNPRVEPMALAELVTNKLAVEVPARMPHPRSWELTIAGIAVRKAIRKE